MHTKPVPPTADPLPWVTAQMRRAGVFEDGADDATRMRRVLDVLTANVSALHDDFPYRVVLSKGMTTAGTAYKERLVLVGSKALNDAALTDGQKAAVTMGLVLHEVGHVRWGREYDVALQMSTVGGTKLVGSVSNLAADLHNEAAAMRLFPGLAHAVEVAMWWVSKHQTTDPVDLTTVAGRANAALAACRYPWVIDWTGHEDWLATWSEWARRAEQAGEPHQHVDIVREALDIIRDLPEPEPEPEPHDDGDEGGDGTPTPSQPSSDGPDDDEGNADEGDACDDGEPSDDPGDDGDDTDGSDDGDDGDDTEDGDDDGEDAGGSNGTDDEEDDTDDDGEGSGPSAGGDDAEDADDTDADGQTGDGDGDGDESGDDAGQSDGDGRQQGDGEEGSTGSIDASTFDPADEDSDDIKDACAAHTAHDEEDEKTQNDINAQLLRERTSGTQYVFHHSTSTYAKRVVVLAKKSPGGFRL